MADSTCLLRGGFSYASSVIPKDSKQGNPMHVLGESISFGRFMTESISWEDKWTTFSPHKKYVEEAQRYAKPGSVAQKKAFFEAHYKKIAAQKAAAAALLEQEDAAKSCPQEEEAASDVSACGQQIVASSPLVEVVAEMSSDETNCVMVADEGLQESPVKSTRSSNTERDSISASESSEAQQMERPLLKHSVAKEDAPSVMSKKGSSFSSLRSTIQRKTWKIPSTPLNQFTPRSKKDPTIAAQSTRKRSSPKSLFSSNKGPDKELVSSSTKKALGSRLHSGSYRMLTKDHHTPLRTPLMGESKISSKYAAATPQSQIKRLQTPVNPSAPGGKTGPKRHIFSAIYSKSLSACRNKLQSPTLSSPFLLRTEERAAKRKQKLEEKFNASEAQKEVVQHKTLKNKAGEELRKLGCGFCFKARPLPDFYKEREPLKTQLRKIEDKSQQPPLPGRSIPNKAKGNNVSMPKPPPPPTKNSASNLLLPKKKVVSKPVATSKSLANSSDKRIAQENESPNIRLL